MRRRLPASTPDQDQPDHFDRNHTYPPDPFQQQLDHLLSSGGNLPSAPDFGFDLSSYWYALLAIFGDFTNPLRSIASVVLAGLYQLYLAFAEFGVDIGESMTFGFARLWPRNGEDQEGRKDLIEVDGDVSGKRVRRRRRKDTLTALHVDVQYFPGMINLSGVLCYMNSVLQALASIESLIAHLERITALAVEADFPSPVTDALSDVLTDLNTPQHRQPPALRPHALLKALQPLPQIRRLLSTREQQDAHELFVVLAEAVSDEALRVAGEVMKLRGLAEVASLQAYCSTKVDIPMLHDTLGKEKKRKVKALAQPWEGLLARRRVCRRCGWSEAVRMDTLGGMELPVPQHGDVGLDACIAEYLATELLTGVTCEFCSVRQTLEWYQAEGSRLSSSSPSPQLNGHTPHSGTASGSFSVLENLPTQVAAPLSNEKRKKKARDAKRVGARLQEMLDSSSIIGFGDPSIPPSPSSSSTSPIPVKWQKVNCDSVREAIVTRPPPSLRLHLIRSGYTPYGTLIKKTARVAFPLILDLTRFVSKGVWDERTDIRTAFSNLKKDQLPPALPPPPDVLYRLESVILHYGYTHSSGHFVAIRRKPRPAPAGEACRPSRGRKSCPDGCRCQSCLYFGQVRDIQSEVGKGWLRISDADVEEVGEEALVEASGAAFMLFYERVGEYDGAVKKPLAHPDESEGSVASRLLQEREHSQGSVSVASS